MNEGPEKTKTMCCSMFQEERVPRHEPVQSGVGKMFLRNGMLVNTDR